MKQEANIFDWHYQVLPSECRNYVGIVQQMSGVWFGEIVVKTKTL
ncbi:hypothetical protein [Okeania sp. KiyG1]|nr:hypothetical protein [Okeania sp. KiyG1]